MTVKIQPVAEPSIRAVFELATEVFVENSTLHKALGTGLQEYREYLWPSFASMIAEGLSIAAIDADSDELLGCLIVSDFHRHLDNTSGEEGRFAPLNALAGQLSEQYLQKRRIGAGKVILVDMGAVSPEAAGRGIYQLMRNAAQNLAREKGYTNVVGELSSASTQHVVLNKLGHMKMAEVWFEGFTYKGEYPFHSIKEPPSIILAEGEL